jgi:hypothetical protein
MQGEFTRCGAAEICRYLAHVTSDCGEVPASIPTPWPDVWRPGMEGITHHDPGAR